MKSRFSIALTAVTICAALAIPVPLAAQQNTQHHHYQFIDLGTFGGPMSATFGIYPAVNNEGTVIGWADTTTADPFYPNFNPLIIPAGDPYIFHAFQWKDGHLVDLGSLPGGYSSSPGGISKNGLIAGQAINGAIDP